MNTKTITRIILFGVIGVAVGVWAVKQLGHGKGKGGDIKAAASVVRPDGVTVIHFHGDKRCRTCIRIGDLAKKTVDEGFPDEEKARKVRWEQLNYDEAANAHYVKDYQLVSSTVVVTLWKNGKELKWNRLDEVWDYVGDEPAFRTYVAEGVRDLLNQL